MRTCFGARRRSLVAREDLRSAAAPDGRADGRRGQPTPQATIKLPPSPITVRPIEDSVWPALCAYDAAAFGAERGTVLARLRGRLPAADLVAERNGRVAGFLLGRDGRVAVQAGPLIADDDAVARALLARALDALPAPVFVDLADAKAEVRRWLEARGFSAVRPLTRMLYGRSQRYDDAARTFAVVGPEFG